MNWKVCTGNGKIAQFKELEALCNYHKEGHKIIIDEVYKKKLVKLSKGKYANDIQLLLLHILSCEKEGKIETTMKNLMRLLDIVNNNYVVCYMNKTKIVEKTKIEEPYVEEVYSILSSYRTIIDSALKSLKRSGLISLKINPKISYNAPVYKTNEDGTLFRDINGDCTVIRYDETFEYANDETIRLILNIMEEEMLKLGVRDERCFYINRELGLIWQRNTKSRLKEYNINYMFDCYEIIYNYETIERRLKRIDETEVRNRLNSNVLSRVITTINNNHEQNILNEDVQFLIENDLYTMEEIEGMFKLNELKGKEDYVDKCSKIARLIIDRNIRTRDKIK